MRSVMIQLHRISNVPRTAGDRTRSVVFSGMVQFGRKILEVEKQFAGKGRRGMRNDKENSTLGMNERRLFGSLGGWMHCAVGLTVRCNSILIPW
jgi:hypothetical protein